MSIYPYALSDQEKQRIGVRVFGKSANLKFVDWEGVYQLSPEIGIQAQPMVWSFVQNRVGPTPKAIEDCFKFGVVDNLEKTSVTDVDEAVVIFWGKGPKPASNILHASRLYTHQQILQQAAVFDLKIDEERLRQMLPDPVWTSALGNTFGVICHSRDWLYNVSIKKGKFGTTQGAMKKAK